MRAIFIRHGQSTGNIGIPSTDLSQIALTDLGRQQAQTVAAAWTERPSLIVTSPYLRARQTAQPSIARFTGVPVEIWPIAEFTYLCPTHWNGTSSTERLPVIERYWAAADPDYCDGDGAESFTALLHRVEATLTRLAALPADSLVYLFSHGQFIQALRTRALDPEQSPHDQMRDFWRRGEPVIANVEQVALGWDGGRWFSF